MPIHVFVSLQRVDGEREAIMTSLSIKHSMRNTVNIFITNALRIRSLAQRYAKNIPPSNSWLMSRSRFA